MSYFIFNANGLLQTSVKEKNDLNLVRGDVAHHESLGLVKEVSRDEYKSVVCAEKQAALQDGNVVFTEPEAVNADDLIDNTQEIYQNTIDSHLSKVDNFMTKHAVKLANAEHSSLNTRLNEYKTALTNLDASTVSYSKTTNFLRYWFDNQSVEPFSNSYLQ
jgi:hypothetical protein